MVVVVVVAVAVVVTVAMVEVVVVVGVAVVVVIVVMAVEVVVAVVMGMEVAAGSSQYPKCGLLTKTLKNPVCMHVQFTVHTQVGPCSAHTPRGKHWKTQACCGYKELKNTGVNCKQADANRSMARREVQNSCTWF